MLNFDEILSDWDDCDSCEFEYEADQDNERSVGDIVNVAEAITNGQIQQVSNKGHKLTKS